MPQPKTFVSHRRDLDWTRRGLGEAAGAIGWRSQELAVVHRLGAGRVFVGLGWAVWKRLRFELLRFFVCFCWLIWCLGVFFFLSCTSLLHQLAAWIDRRRSRAMPRR